MHKEDWSDPEYCMMMVKENGHCLKMIENQTSELCLAAVNNTPWALEYVKEQTEEICLTAVKKNSWLLMYIKKQTEEICSIAIADNLQILEYIQDQTLEICTIALKNHGPIALNKMRHRTPEIYLIAVQLDKDAIKWVPKAYTEIYEYWGLLYA